MDNVIINLGTKDKTVITGKINISIDFRFDTDTKDLVIGTAAASIDDLSSAQVKQVTITRSLTRTEKVYYLILLGAGKISETLLPNSIVNVTYNGQIYQGVMHSQTRGRVCKLQPMYVNNPELTDEDVTIRATYDIETNTLEVEKC